VFRYEKFRTEWEMEDGHLVLDETPIGVWAELEGQPLWIDATLEKLGIAASCKPQRATARSSCGGRQRRAVSPRT
jgi:adenylate cyclase